MPKSCHLSEAAGQPTRSQLDLGVLLCTSKPIGSSGWTSRSSTSQCSLLKLLTLADQDRDFQKEPKGLTDLPAATALKAVGAELLTPGSPSTQGRAELYGHGHADLGSHGSRSSTSHVCTQVTFLGWQHNWPSPKGLQVSTKDGSQMPKATQ